jgi:hypothetical protein
MPLSCFGKDNSYYFTLPEHKFLLGGVSISNQFSDFSKSLMIEFMKSNYYDPYINMFILRKPIK